jgi:hypothetical protein
LPVRHFGKHRLHSGIVNLTVKAQFMVPLVLAFSSAICCLSGSSRIVYWLMAILTSRMTHGLSGLDSLRLSVEIDLADPL